MFLTTYNVLYCPDCFDNKLSRNDGKRKLLCYAPRNDGGAGATTSVIKMLYNRIDFTIVSFYNIPILW